MVFLRRCVDNSFQRAFQLFDGLQPRGKHLRGEHLLFLNNDIEIIDPGGLEELVCWAELSGIGVVGTKLLYPDGKIQHAGVVLSTLTSHMFYQEYDDLAIAPY